MRKLLIWPIFILALHGFIILDTYFQPFHQGSLGLELAGIGIIEILLIASLITYIPLSILYIGMQKIRHRNISIWAALGLVVVSSLLGGYLLTLSTLSFIDSIFMSDWWWLRF